MARRPKIAEQIELEAVTQMPSQAAPVAVVSNMQTVPAAPAPASSETAALIAMLERAARDPDVNIDKMERAFEMLMRVLARNAESAFNAAMAAAQAEMQPVARKLNNAQTNSTYADLGAISEAVDPIIHKHGLGCTTSEFRSDVPGHIGVRIKIRHAEGHSETYDFNIPVDAAGIEGNVNKTPTHAYASTLTYGRRYAKCAVFDIATKNDTDGNQPKNEPQGVITDDQHTTLLKLITESGADISKVLETFRVESLPDLPLRFYGKLKLMLEKRKENIAKRAAQGQQDMDIVEGN